MGNPKAIQRSFLNLWAPPAIRRMLRKILGRSSGVLGYLFAIRRHEDLLEALGQPSFAAGLGFKYISKGDLPTGLEPEQLLLV
jgi:hypothetical protein